MLGIDTPARPALLEQLDLDQAAIAAGTATQCAASCACHGGIVCLRAAHPHDVDDVHPHAGYDGDGQLVQWAHTDEHGPLLTAEQAAAQLAQTRREHTRALLAGLDLDELRAALADAPERTGPPPGGEHATTCPSADCPCHAEPTSGGA